MLEAALDFGDAGVDTRLYCTPEPALRYLAGLRRHVLDQEQPVAMVILGAGMAASRRGVVTRLRRAPALREVPLVIVAFEAPREDSGVIEAGADASLLKAPGFDGMLRVLEEAQAFHERVLAYCAARACDVADRLHRQAGKLSSQ